MENRVNYNKFATNAIISKDNLGFLFVVPFFQVAIFGEFIFITQNTCKTYQMVVASENGNRNFIDELRAAILEIQEQIKNFKCENDELTKQAICKLSEFCNSFLEFITDGQQNLSKKLAKIIFPSYSEDNENGNMLRDLSTRLPNRFKGFAFPFSGENDDDQHGLIKDEEKMNVADLYGLGKIKYENGSHLISWLPTGIALKDFKDSLLDLLKNVGFSFEDQENKSEYYCVYVVQALMNVICAYNSYSLSLIEFNKINNNFREFVDGVIDRKKDLFHDPGNILKSSDDNDCNFIRFLFKKICVGTSLENIDLTEGGNKKKYCEFVIGMSNLLCGSDQANQVLALWKQNPGNSTFSDGIVLKNKTLYVSLSNILRDFIKNKEFKNVNGVDLKSIEKLKQNLTFMINLSGKLRYQKTEFDLSETKSVENSKFGWQTNVGGTYQKPVNYDTDINVEKLISLTKEIIEFEEYIKMGKIDLEHLVKYLLDGRYFGYIDGSDDECIKKVIENKDLMCEFIQKVDAKDNTVCQAYEIFVNEYFDFIENNDFIKMEYLEDDNLVKFFARPENTQKIIELDIEKILQLDLVPKLGSEMINKFLGGNENDKKRINQVLEKCVNILDTKILSALDFANLSNEVIESIVLFKSQILSDDIVRRIDFSKLLLEAQIKLFNWMAKEESFNRMVRKKFNSFTKEHLKQIDSDVFVDKTVTIQDLYEFCCVLQSKIGCDDNFEKFDRADIIQKLPVDLLMLYEKTSSENDSNSKSYFKDFLTNGNICSCLSDKQVLLVGSVLTNGTKTSDFESKKSMIKNLDSEIINENSKKTIYDFAIRVYGRKYKDIKTACYYLFLYLDNKLLAKKSSDDQELFGKVIKYIFDNYQDFHLYAFIILEFIMSDEISLNIKENIKENSSSRQKIESIKNNIKKVLNWDKADERKKIIRDCFLYIDDINKFINCIDDIYVDGIRYADDINVIDGSKRENSVIKVYRSFLDNLVSKYIDDLEPDNIKKIPFYYLKNENIEALCRRYPGKIQDDNFFTLIKKFNSMFKVDGISEKEYKQCYITSFSMISKFAIVTNIYDENRTEIQGQGSNDEITLYTDKIKENLNKIYNGYAACSEGIIKKIENDLKNYDVSAAQKSSPVYKMFISSIDSKEDKKTLVEKNKLSNTLNVDKLKTILKNENYNEFEQQYLSLVKNDWKKMNFKSFAKKYDLLKNIDNSNERLELIIDFYVDFRESLKNKTLKFEFIKNHCLNFNYDWLTSEIKNQAIEKIKLNKRYNSVGERCLTACQLIGNVKFNNKVLNQVIGICKVAINDACVNNSDVQWNSIPDSENWKNNTIVVENVQQAKKYFSEIENFILCFDFIFDYVMPAYEKNDMGDFNSRHWIERLLFENDNDNTRNQVTQLNTIYEDYQSKTDDSWINFSEVYILKYISTERIKKYRASEQEKERYATSLSDNNRLKDLLVRSCGRLNMRIISDKGNRLKFVFVELEKKKIDLLQKQNYNLMSEYTEIVQQEKFLECAYKNNFFSNEQIIDTGIINFYDVNKVEYTPDFVIKYLSLMIQGGRSVKFGLSDEEKEIIYDLKIHNVNKNYFAYVAEVLLSRQITHVQLTKIMEKIFFGYEFTDESSLDCLISFNKNDFSARSKLNMYQSFLRTQLLDLLGYDFNGKIKTKNNQGTLMEYDKMTGNQDEDIRFFVLADFTFVHIKGYMEKMIYKLYRAKKLNEFETEWRNYFSELTKKIRERLLSILEQVKLDKDQKILERDLNELIARGFLRLASYERLDLLHQEKFLGNNELIAYYQRLRPQAENIAYEEIISMLARCDSVDEFRNKKFNRIAEIQDWINTSSVKYFVPLRLWYDSSDEMPKYVSFCSRILSYILDHTENVSTVDILHSLYINENHDAIKVYKFCIDQDCMKKLLDKFELETETNPNNIADNVDKLAKFLNNISYNSEKECRQLIKERMIKIFSQNNMIKENKFQDSKSMDLYLSFVFKINMMKHFYIGLLMSFFNYLDFDKIALSDVIDSLGNYMVSNKAFCYYCKEKHRQYLDKPMEEIHQRTKKTELKSYDSIKKVIQIFCSVGYMSNTADHYNEFLYLFGQIIKINGNTSIESKNNTKVKLLKQNLKSIDKVFSDMKADKENKDILNKMENDYIFNFISDINSLDKLDKLDELKEILEIVKNRNNDKFPNIYINVSNRENDFGYKILQSVRSHLQQVQSQKVIDDETFLLFVSFFSCFKFSEQEQNDGISLISEAIYALLSKSIEINIDNIKKYIEVIKKVFLLDKKYAVICIYVLEKFLDGKETKYSSVFDIMCYITNDKNFYSNPQFYEKKWIDEIKTELELEDDNSKNNQDKFDILINSPLLKAIFDEFDDSDFNGNVDNINTFLQCLYKIKKYDAHKSINTTENLEEYFNSIWQPILKAADSWPFDSNMKKEIYFKSRAGLFRKIIIEHVLDDRNENKIPVLDVLKFVVNKFPLDENTENKKPEIRYDVSLKIKKLASDKDIALDISAEQVLNVFISLSKSNVLNNHAKYSMEQSVESVFEKTLKVPEINNENDIDKFMSSLKRQLVELGKGELISSKCILINIFKSKKPSVTISQMLDWICSKDVLLNQSSMDFINCIIENLQNNSSGSESIDSIDALCKLLKTIGPKDPEDYNSLKSLVEYLTDGSIKTIEQLEIILEYCTNSRYCHEKLLDYSIGDMKLLKNKISVDLINNNISDIADITQKYIICTVTNDEKKTTPAEFFNLLMDGFISEFPDTAYYGGSYIKKALILNIDYKDYPIKDYIESFADVLRKKALQHLSVYKKAFQKYIVTYHNYLQLLADDDDCKPKFSIDKSWLINMYLLTCLFESPELLDQESNFYGILNTILPNELKNIKMIKEFDCKQPIKIFLITQTRNKKIKLDAMKTIANKFEISFSKEEISLTNFEPKVNSIIPSENKVISNANSICNNDKPINDFIIRNITRNEDNGDVLINSQSIDMQNIGDTQDDSKLVTEHNKNASRPNYWLFYFISVLFVIVLTISIFLAVKHMWLLFVFASLTCVITVVIAYINRPFWRNRDNKGKLSISTNNNPEYVNDQNVISVIKQENIPKEETKSNNDTLSDNKDKS